MLWSYKWDGLGLGWMDLCVGWLYEHRFAVLIKAPRNSEVVGNVLIAGVGVWAEWGQWSECNSTSSNSTKFRFRNCNNATSVSSCDGDPTETASCSSGYSLKVKHRHMPNVTSYHFFDYFNFHRKITWIKTIFINRKLKPIDNFHQKKTFNKRQLSSKEYFYQHLLSKRHQRCR